jgi:hypothetical protein
LIEIASNDGHLLQFVAKAYQPLELNWQHCQCRTQKGVPTLVKFFTHSLGKELTREGKQADLVLATNTLARVPDLNDFVGGRQNGLNSGAAWRSQRRGRIAMEIA